MRRYPRRALAAVVWSLAFCGCAVDGGREGEGECQVEPDPTPFAGTSSSAERPWTIPALRQWQGGAGEFRFGEDFRIIIAPADRARLISLAEAFAHDVSELTGREPPVVSGPEESTRAGDLGLGLGECETRIGREGYRMTVEEAVRLRAIDPAGVFYGTRTVLQLLRQGTSIPRGQALDWPRYPERGLMVDIGRKYFTPRWLVARIRELADLKLNYLHLHFTDNQGWRIESEMHPEVVSAEHLGKAEVRELIALAARHHVLVVPEIDMPGHMGAALRAHPEWQLRDVLGLPAPGNGNLDYTLPGARRFAFELVEEYLDLFPGPYWHAGADEYLITSMVTPLAYAPYPQLEAYARRRYGPQATVKDGLLGFVNEVGELARAHGKTLRVWNDGLAGGRVVALDPDAVVDVWTNLDGLGPQPLLEAGHRIMNAGWFPTYFVSGFPTGLIPGYPSNTLPILPPQPDMRSAYESWSVDHFYGPITLDADLAFRPAAVARDEPGNLGSKLHVWNDDPSALTEDEIAAAIFPRLRVIAQKTWESPSLTPSYAAFQAVIDAVGAPPE